MSEATLFCVRCGKTTAIDLLRGGLCADCFLEERQFTTAPLTVDFEICSHCGARKKGEMWVDDVEGVTEGNVRQAVADNITVKKDLKDSRIRVEMRQEDQHGKIYACTVTVTGVAEGLPVQETHELRARIKGATCLRCSRVHGNYYEGIVQLRAENRDVSKEEMRTARQMASRIIERIVREGDRYAFVLKDEPMDGGLDIYVGTINTGRAIAKAFADEFGARTKETAKMVGAKDGNTLYRLTFLVRLPEYRAGDLLIWKDVTYLVKSVTPKRTTLTHLRTGHQVTADRDDLERAKVLSRAQGKEAIVVSEQGSDLQIMDPNTYATVTVIAPLGYVPGSETLLVAKWEDEWIPFPLPEALRVSADSE
ncbi:MAG TPA: NMD3-related protein [Candidatus Thermoplasmatota archaeon]|nr:NMD3-related protein [Candidatus Thermoplasmatota archaeon]